MKCCHQGMVPACGLRAGVRTEEVGKDMVGGSVWWAWGGGVAELVISDNIDTPEDGTASKRPPISKAGP